MSKVYQDKFNNLYSKGVTRSFGTNRAIKLRSNIIKQEDDFIFCSVQPLLVNPRKHNFMYIGDIE